MTESSVKLSIAQLFTLLVGVSVPLCYVFGYRFSQGYFDELGCAWLVPLLTWQDTLMRSANSIMLMMVIFSFTLGCLLYGHKSRSVLKWYLYFGLFMLISAIVLAMPEDRSLNTRVSFVFASWMIGFIGANLAVMVRSLHLGDAAELNETVAWLLISVFSFWFALGEFGKFVARQSLKNESFAVVGEGYQSGKVVTRLIAKVDGSYLLMRSIDGIREFEISSSINDKSLKVLNKTK